MNNSLVPHDLSLQAFITYSEKWATESPDYVSLSKYSISGLLSLAQAEQLKGDSLALLLSAVALKREHEGASKFIFRSFADSPPEFNHPKFIPQKRISAYEKQFPNVDPIVDPIVNLYVPHGLGAPDTVYFQGWLNQKSSGTRMDVPAWELPLLADYADEFLHLSNCLGSLSKESDVAFLPFPDGQKGSYSMAEVLNQSLFFGYEQELTSLATKILESAVHQHRENPIDLLLQALEEIGVATQRTNTSKIVTKGESTDFRNLTIDRESSEKRGKHISAFK